MLGNKIEEKLSSEEQIDGMKQWKTDYRIILGLNIYLRD